MKKKTDTERAKDAGLSRSQLNEARKLGVDVDNPEALAAHRSTINTRSDDRSHPPKPLRDGNEQSVTMTIEDIELALTQKGVTPNEARALKTQLEGLKVAMALKQQRNLLLSREEVREMFTAAGHAIRASLLKIESDLVPKLVGRSEAESRGIAREELRHIMGKLQDAESEFWTYHQLTD